MVCPYCGHTGPRESRCPECKGYLDPLSQQATQNMMGPWEVRDPRRPYHPGISYDKLRELASRGRIAPDTVVRGPSTRQFWMPARLAPGVANLIGTCHNCAARVNPDDYLCVGCGVVLTPAHDRQSLGLAPIQLLPGDAPAEALASRAVQRAVAARPASPGQPLAGVASAAEAQSAQASSWMGDRAASAPTSSPTPSRFVNDGAPIDPAAQHSPGNNPEPHPALAQALHDARARRASASRTRWLFVGASIVVLLSVGYFAASELGLLKPAATNEGKASTATLADAPMPTDAPAPGDTPSQAAPDNATTAGLRDGATTPAPTTVAPGTTPNDQEVDPDDAGLDAGLEPWIENYRKARELERTDTRTDLEQAIEILEAIIEQARASEAGKSDTPRRYPLIEDRIERLRARLDEILLKELL